MTAARPLSDLRHDNSGAVMMTGLFMSCFLIGSLWFVIGIGDTIVFRDKMQEAADHGAFASAALHAKGMNFISLCNLILLAAVTIHIILGIVHDIALAICIISLGFGCGFWSSMRRVYTGYFKILKPAAKAIHIGELVASYGYPVMGLAEGMQIGSSYGGGRGTGEVTVVPLSTSLIPGALIRAAGGSAMKKEGLPVEAKPMNYLCKKIVNVGFNTIFQTALGVSGKSPGGKALDLAKTIIGSIVEFRYCNDLGNSAGRYSQGALNDKIGEGNNGIDEANKDIDEKNSNRKKGDPIQERIDRVQQGSGGGGGGIDPGFDPFWGENGPMVVFGPASNGNEWFQTYAINWGPEMTDMSESRVGIGRGTKLGMQKYEKQVGPIGYFAQAEFYFDCDKDWGDPACNAEDNATFQIKWRARLRRLSLPNVASMLSGAGLEILFNLQKYDQFKKLEGQFGSKARQIFGTGVAGTQSLRVFIDYLTKQGEDAIKSGVGDATKGLTPTLNGVYH
jgi:hypothetical protein